MWCWVHTLNYFHCSSWHQSKTAVTKATSATSQSIPLPQGHGLRRRPDGALKSTGIQPEIALKLRLFPSWVCSRAADCIPACSTPQLLMLFSTACCIWQEAEGWRPWVLESKLKSWPLYFVSVGRHQPLSFLLYEGKSLVTVQKLFADKLR